MSKTINSPFGGGEIPGASGQAFEIEARLGNDLGGSAVADVLKGLRDPYGRLPMTFVRSEGQIPLHYDGFSSGRPGPKTEVFWSHYTDESNAPAFPFGFGLSYTQFTYSGMKVQPQKAQAGQEVTVSVEIKNSGQREGDEVVQLYLRDLISSVTTYEKVLRGFERVRLKAGEKRTLTFSLARQDMELIDRQNQRTVEPGEFVVELGSSSTDIRQTAKFQIAP